MKVVCVYLSLIVAVSVSALPDNQFNVLVKKLEHTAVVQGKPAAAAEPCLATLKNETLSTNQASRLQKLLNISALESNNNDLIRKVVDYCTEKNIRCDALRQKLGFASAEERNLQGDRIREALEYQWHNLQWEKNNPDYSVFKDYLQDNLCNNTNISETARIQAAIFLTSLDWWRNSDIRDTLGLTSNIVIRNYELLLKDVYHSNGNNPMVEYTAVLNRLLSIAKEYVIQEQPLLVSSIRNRIIIYSYKISKEKKTSDLFRVLAHKLGIYSAEEIRSAFKGQPYNTQKYIPIKVIIQQCLHYPRKSGIIIRQLLLRWKDISLSNYYDKPYQYQPLDLHSKASYSRFYMTNNLPDSLNSAFLLSGTNILHNLAYPDVYLTWNATNIVTGSTSDSSGIVTKYAKAVSSIITFTGQWDKAVWNNNLSQVSNAIWSIEEPLNEIRKYVLLQKKEKERTTVETQQSRTELWLEFTNNWMVFVRQGPTNGAQALPALDRAIEKYELMFSDGQIQEIVMNYLQELRKIFASDYIAGCKYFISKKNVVKYRFQQADLSRWYAAYLLPKITELKTMLENTDDPVLQKQFAYKFYRQYRGSFSAITPELSPARTLFEYVLDRDLPSTVLQPLIMILKTRLQEMLVNDQPYISPVTYAEMIDRCMPVFAACPNYCVNIISANVPIKDNWQLQARIDAAVAHLHEAAKRNENEQVYLTIQILTELIRGIREDAGVSIKTTDWLKKLGLMPSRKTSDSSLLSEFLSDLSVYINGIITNSPKSLAARTRITAVLSNSTIRCRTEPSRSSKEFMIFINRYPDERLRNSQFKELNVKAGNLHTNLTLNLKLGNSWWVLHNYQTQVARLIDAISRTEDRELQKEYVNQFRSMILQHEVNIRYPSLHVFDYLLYDIRSPTLLSALSQRVNTLIQEYTDNLNRIADFADGFELAIPLIYTLNPKSKQNDLIQKFIKMARSTMNTQSDWRRKGYVNAIYSKFSNLNISDRECLQILTDFIV